MIDLTINEEQLRRTVQRAREKNIIIPIICMPINLFIKHLL